MPRNSSASDLLGRWTRHANLSPSAPRPDGRPSHEVVSVTASEMPTFFGPSNSPLFGVLHLPWNKRIRGGVLICGSLGKEGMDSVRLQRVLAEDLAERGFAVLRFDYLCSGDSAYRQDHEDAVANWCRSVNHAIEYLREVGAQSITAVALRAGCLILSEAMTKSDGVDRVVYFDPVGTGRRYLREQAMLFRLAVGEDAAMPGTVSIIGARLSEQAAAEFGALRLDVARPDVVDHLLILRSAESDERVLAVAGLDGVQSITVRGLSEFAQPADVLVPMPLDAADAVVEWVDSTQSASRTSATPRYANSVKMPSEAADGTAIVECIESIGPKGLFAIRTRPALSASGEGKVVVFYATANDPHVGPSREWVELSRRIAANGSQAMRWDRFGVGSSRPIRRRQWRAVYSRADISDAIAAARHAANDPGSLQLVGICSGSWYAAQAARAVGSRSVVMVNQLMWNWRINVALLWQWNVKRSLYGAAVAARGPESEAECRRRRVIASLKAFLGPALEMLKNLTHTYAPRPVMRQLGRMGLAQVPEMILAPLAQQGTNATVLASPRDAELFAAYGGRSALSRLQRTPAPPRLVTTSTGDHAGHHPVILEAIRKTVLAQGRTPPSRQTDSDKLVNTMRTARDNPRAVNVPGDSSH